MSTHRLLAIGHLTPMASQKDDYKICIGLVAELDAGVETAASGGSKPICGKQDGANAQVACWNCHHHHGEGKEARGPLAECLLPHAGCSCCVDNRRPPAEVISVAL